MDEMAELLHEFVTQSRENLDKFEADLVALEREPASRPLIDRVFRNIHTIKGTSGFLGLGKLQALTHTGEGLLGRARDGSLVLDGERINALLRLADVVRRMLGSIETSGQEGDEDHAALAAEIERLKTPAAAQSEAPRTVERAEPTAADSERSVRVDVDLLDRLMNLVGELVLARNQVLQFVPGAEDPALGCASHALDRITSELQATVMRTRLLPIRNVLGKVPRMARDLAAAFGKSVRVEMSGEDTELDKSLLEAIRDPIGHLVRNCIDHGIEAPEARTALGKPAEGQIVVRAWHEGGQVHVEVADDGRGIDPEVLRQSAIGLGILGPAEAVRLSDREALALIFRPGFSTAREVTSVSGRGVGMDVVRTDIERIGGAVAVTSLPGSGTSFKIQIPLTLAILPALVVLCGGERYAIPQASLLELLRLDSERARTEVGWIDDQAVLRLRGRLLPLVFLERVLRTAPGDAPERRRDDTLQVAVLEAEGRSFGLVVDRVHDTAEIVVKPLAKHLKDLRLFAGATILGDGRVALILDVLGLAQHAGVSAHPALQRSRAEDAAASPAAELRSLLLLESGGERLALPLAVVTRLEELPRSDVETVGGRLLARYRGQVLPLVPAPALLGTGAWDTAGRAESLPVVVVARDGARCGLAVDRILDVVPEGTRVEGAVRRPGIVGRMVVQERVTDVLDVEALLRSAAGAIPAGDVASAAWAAISGSART